jgi:hypothetical protein
MAATKRRRSPEMIPYHGSVTKNVGGLAELHDVTTGDRILQLQWILSAYCPRVQFRMQESESLSCEEGPVLSVACHKHCTQLRPIMRKLHICSCCDGQGGSQEAVWTSECWNVGDRTNCTSCKQTQDKITILTQTNHFRYGRAQVVRNNKNEYKYMKVKTVC